MTEVIKTSTGEYTRKKIYALVYEEAKKHDLRYERSMESFCEGITNSIWNTLKERQELQHL